jgi:flagellar protein FlgJ
MAIKSSTDTDPGFYADLNQLQSLKRTAKTDQQAALRDVAEQFEQIFLNMMMKSMRQANEAFASDDVFNSSQVRFYQDMLDSQMTTEMASGGGVGLADVLVRQLSQQFNVRMDSDDDDKKVGEVSDSERLLQRAFDTGAISASSQALGRLYGSDEGLTHQEPGVTPIDQTISELSAKAQRQTEDLPERFESPQQFVDSLLPLAEEMAPELGVDPKVLLAQAALETGWGKYVIQGSDGQSSHNLFNIKAGRSWDGDRATVNTLEYRDGIAQKERADFRQYDSYADSFRDYVDFLKNSTRYQEALNVAHDPSEYLNKLQEAGYATDPNYAKKITDIFENRIMAMGLNSGSSEG